MSLLLTKLALAPACVAIASLIGRRFGPRAGGLAGGLPVVGGPILLVLTMQHDRAFGSAAAAGSLGGLFATTVFVLVYARLAVRAGPVACVVAGWAAFLVTIALLSAFDPLREVALAMACGSFALAPLLMPDLGDQETEPPRPPRWDLPVRMAVAAALVVAISAASSVLGSRVSGLLTPFPILTAVLGVFTQYQAGAASVEPLMRGFLVAYFSFAAFSYVVSLALESMAIGPAFAVASAAAIVTQIATVTVTRSRERRIPERAQSPAESWNDRQSRDAGHGGGPGA